MNSFLPSGCFSVGANYWASHAGTAMWRDWRPEVIDRDFGLLAANGLQVLRVFALWPDFQPITQLRTEKGKTVEFRWGESPLPDDAPHGVSGEMLERFGVLADTARNHGLELIVGLVTGWMSGRLFVPPALDGLNPITDPVSVMWQVRLARTIVQRFKEHPAIVAWDLGNECNVMGEASGEESWLWTAAISNAIRAVDATRPVVSGMHSLDVNPRAPWSIRQQGELTDFLTTHPYPIFTPHCHREPLNTMRPILHGTAETCLYADLGGKPALVEEFGNIGPGILGDDETAGFMRASLASFWAHDCRAGLWWCAHDQTTLEHAPYDWVAIERELGLVTAEGRAKPGLLEMKAFKEFLATAPALPKRNIDAVCILTPGQDNWGVAYSAFVLAAQAGFDIRFHYADRALPDAALYLAPSLAGLASLTRRRENELWEKARAGATVYLSLGDGSPAQFTEFAGAILSTRSECKGPAVISFPNGTRIPVAAQLQRKVRLTNGVALAVDDDGSAVFWRNEVGKGEVFVLDAPLEASVALEPSAFHGPAQPACRDIYRAFASRVLAQRLVRKTQPHLGITEHPLPGGGALALAINYSPEPLQDELLVREGFAIGGGNSFSLKLGPHDYAVLNINKA